MSLRKSPHRWNIPAVGLEGMLWDCTRCGMQRLRSSRLSPSGAIQWFYKRTPHEQWEEHNPRLDSVPACAGGRA